jgi:HEAT repeat protein
MNISKPLLGFTRFATTALLCGALSAMAEAAQKTNPLVERARAVLLTDLEKEKAFVKVHAAEALIALGEKEAPRRVFAAELPAANDVRPYRIGVWRVLAAASASQAERAKWIAQTEAVVLDEATLDRLHAVESLGKLGHAPTGRVRSAIADMANGPAAAAVFPRWVLHLAGDRTALPAIVAALASEDPVARLRAAYVLHWLKINDPATRRALDRTAEREPKDAVGYAIVICAAVGLDANPAQTPARIAILEHILANDSAGARYQTSQTLMQRYTAADFPKLVPLLDHAEGDARIGAAWAILHISSKR